MRCGHCAGDLSEIDRWDGKRSWVIYECQDCGRVGGKATGYGLPDEDWGAVERATADGGTVGDEVGTGGTP